MSIRHVARTVAVSGVAALCGALFLLAVDSGVAGADLVSGFTTLSAGSSATPGTPYSDGQKITVSVAGGTGTLTCGANTANPNPLSSSYQVNCGAAAAPTSYYLEECNDPGGTTGGLPNGYAGCEAGTLVTLSSNINTTTGAITPSVPNFTVFALPDVGAVGGPTSTGSCGLAPNYCVVGVFAGNPNQGGTGFAKPRLFSAPFQIASYPDQNGLNLGDTGYSPDGVNPGDGTPEVPLAIGLPLLAMGAFGGVLVRNRRRRQQASQQAS